MSSASESLVEMGFPKDQADKALLKAKGSIEQALTLLAAGDPMEVEDTPPPAPSSPSSSSSSSSATSDGIARSYKCNETGKLFRTYADVQMYAERTGRSDFSETTEEVKPRTAEQLAADQQKLKVLIKKKRAEKDAVEKKRLQEAERTRRKGGQFEGSIKEEMAAKQRKVMYAQQKKEKKRVAMERDRLRQEIAKDKAERKARGGNLAGKLSADGYAPAANNLNAQEQEKQQKQQQQKAMEERRKILAKGGVKGFVQDMPKEERLEKALKALSIQKARDAGKVALMTARKMLHRIATNPTEAKYKTVNLGNETLRRKVCSKPGGLNLLLSAGFVKSGDDEKIVMPDDFDSVWLQSVIDQAGVVLSQLTQ